MASDDVEARASSADDTCFVCFNGNAPRSQCLCVHCHVHDACLERWLRQSGRSECSVCRAPYANVDTTHTTGCHANWAVVGALAIIGAMGLAICAALVLAESFRVQHVVTLVFGIFFLSIIPPLLWFGRNAMRDAWWRRCMIFSFVARPQMRVRKVPLAPTPVDGGVPL